MLRSIGRLALLSLLSLPSAHAAVIFVDSLSDGTAVDGNCTLREALIAANTNAATDECAAGNSTGTDTIFILVGGTLNMTNTHMVVSEQVIISGPGIDDLIIDATDRAFLVDMAVPAHDFTLENLTISGGDAGNFNGGAVLLVNVDVASFEGVRFVGNEAWKGGAIGVSNALADDQNEIRIHRCEFQGNHAVYGGGAIDVPKTENAGTRPIDFSATDSSFSGNSAQSKDGGAIELVGNSSATVEIRDCTFTGNSTGERGGALALSGNLGEPFLVENSSFVRNSAGLNGGALNFEYVDVHIAASTFWLIWAGTGGGHLRGSSGFVVLSHVLLGEDLGPYSPYSCYVGTSVISAGYNVAADATCGLDGPGDLENVPSGLVGLGTLGSSMPVAVPGMGSVAIDGGDPSGCLGVDGNPLLVDQRGAPRPVDGDADTQAVCDIGAVEVDEGWSTTFVDSFESGDTVFWSQAVP